MTGDPELTLADLVERLGKSEYWWKRELRLRGHEHLRVGKHIRLTEEQYVALRDSYAVTGLPHEADDDHGDPLQSLTSGSRARSRA